MSPRLLSFRGPVLLGLLALAALFAGFGAWAFLARLEGAIVLRGQVEVKGSLQIVQHPEGGVVAEVYVQEGSLVTAGDPLLRLEDRDLLLERRIALSRIAGLSARRARLVAEREESEVLIPPDGPPDLEPEAEFAAQVRLFDLRLSLYQDARAMLLQRVRQLQSEARGILGEKAALEAELRLVEDDLASQERLFQAGLVTQSVVRALARDAARLRAQLAERAVTAEQIAGQITETGLRIAALRSERIEAATAELREVEPMLAELSETLDSLALRIDRLVVRAPVAGIVLGLRVPKAQVVLPPAAEILTLVPQTDQLVIAAGLAPDDIDGVFPGQGAEITISAFGAALSPRLRGRVTMIAADTLADPETGASFYRVELALDPGELDRLPDRQLVPGMRVETFLATGARSPMTYLLEPFTAFFGRALREG